MRPTDATAYAAGSFRDRGARVMMAGSRVLRALSPSALEEWRVLSRQGFYDRLVACDDVIATRELSTENANGLALPSWAAALLEHERIPFVSYPYEWCFGMLREAALMHLRILLACLDEGAILKDASPYNVQFRGSRPVFIDVASFIAHSENEPWNGYRQFCEMQLFPLMLQAYRGIDFQPLLRSELDGLSAEAAWRWFSWIDLFRQGVATHVWLHGWFRRSVEKDASAANRDLQASGFSKAHVRQNLQGLTRLIERMSWTPPRTTWTNYDESLPHVAADRLAKTAFVREVCAERRRTLTWDLGCNVGIYAKIAAESADTVVAMDRDHGCIERLFHDLRRNGPANILPLRIDVANPSPGLGWRGRERLRLEERGRPDLVLCLGLIHHLVIGANIPMAEVTDWLGELQGDVALEFPTKSDSQVQGLLDGKPDQYDDYSLEELEAGLRRRFTLTRCVPLPSGSRYLLHATFRR